jgi:hypothetical protein
MLKTPKVMNVNQMLMWLLVLNLRKQQLQINNL